MQLSPSLLANFLFLAVVIPDFSLPLLNPVLEVQRIVFLYFSPALQSSSDSLVSLDRLD